MRVALYTAIYGGYDDPKPCFDAGVDCVLFTDDPSLVAPGWRVRYEPLPYISTPMLRAKYWKTHPLDALPGADVSIWVDGSITPGPHFATKCLQAVNDVEIAFTPHPWRDCIYDELDASVGLTKYNATQMRLQCAHYRRFGHPERWGLFATGAMTRRHHRRVRNAMNGWWIENTLWSWQDQLSLPYVMREHPEVQWNTAMPWDTWWTIEEHL